MICLLLHQKVVKKNSTEDSAILLKRNMAVVVFVVLKPNNLAQNKHGFGLN